MDRRHFLRTAAAASALAGAGAVPARAQSDGRSRVAIVRNLDMAREMPETAFNKLLIEMVHESVRALVGGEATIEDAWRTFLQPTDVVGVKLNCIAPPMSPHPAIVEAIAQGCGFCGIPNKVIVFDKEDRDLEASGFTTNCGGNDVQIYGTVGQCGGNPGYEERQTFRRDTAYHLSRIVSRQVTAIVNVPVIKDHAWAGITCALKNHFGCIDNPNAFHKLNACCPAIIDVNHDQNIRNKQRLVICDARAILYEGGPSFKPEYLQPYYAVLAAIDPVALDTTAIELIEMCRVANGLERLDTRERKPVHVAEGARQKLGTNDPAQIEYVSRDLTPAQPAP